jgi:hypothetical protein
VTSGAEEVEVTVSARVAGAGLLPGFDVRADAVALREPADDGVP